MSWLIHEITHVSQYQKYGVVYIFKALRAQRNGGYAYQKTWLDGLLKDLNFEQQAEVAQAYYRDLRNGKSLEHFKGALSQIRDQRFC